MREQVPEGLIRFDRLNGFGDLGMDLRTLVGVDLPRLGPRLLSRSQRARFRGSSVETVSAGCEP